MIPGHRVVDLSLELAESLPCSWPGGVPYRHTIFEWFADDADATPPLVSNGPFHTRWLMLGEHTGTHFDAPTHWVAPPDSGLPGAGPAGAIASERVPLEQLSGPAAVVDVSAIVGGAASGCSPRVEAAALEAFEAEHGPLRPGEVVLLRTGWDRRYLAGAAGARYAADCVARREPAWPAPAAGAIDLLLARRVRCLGVDTPSVGAADDPAAAHLAGLPHGLVYVEGLTRLDELPVRGAIFAFLPLPLRGGSGAPGRAIALVPEG
jgi:kynurenine formamidase